MIDPEQQSELRRRFSPDGSELRELQLRMLEMLKFVDRVCADHGITWWLSSGTCIGAMRHGGFIPWDDDVDIEMLEEDYRKFLRVMGTEPHGDYVLQTRANDPGYILTFAKLRDLRSEMKEASSYDRSLRFRGAFIDVFHLSPSSSRKLHALGRFITRKAHRFAGDTSLTGRLFNGLFFAVKATIFPLLNAIDRIGAGSRLRHEVGSFFDAPRCADDLLPTVRVPFEGVMLPVPANADAYLRRIYGDYNRLPDVDSIKPHFERLTLK